MKITIKDPVVEYPLNAWELQSDRLYYGERGSVCLKSGDIIFFLKSGVTNKSIQPGTFEYCTYLFREVPEGTTVTLTQHIE